MSTVHFYIKPYMLQQAITRLGLDPASPVYTIEELIDSVNQDLEDAGLTYPCPECKTSGQILPAGINAVLIECPTCGGRGKTATLESIIIQGYTKVSAPVSVDPSPEDILNP